MQECFFHMRGWRVVLIGLIGVGASSWVQTADQSLAQIEQGLRKGEMELILPYLHDPVEIAIGGKAKMYSRTQASYVLKDFFKMHPPGVLHLCIEAGRKMLYTQLGLIMARENSGM
jgi:hypothetical protein